MKKPNFDPLLDDLLADSHYDDFRAELKQRTLAEFRSHRRARRLRVAAFCLPIIILAVLLVVSMETKFSHVSESPGRAQEQTRPDLGREALPAPESSFVVETISNEELVASFPPGSCFLAELDGEMVLVFHDPAFRDQVMR